MNCEESTAQSAGQGDISPTRPSCFARFICLFLYSLASLLWTQVACMDTVCCSAEKISFFVNPRKQRAFWHRAAAPTAHSEVHTIIKTSQVLS